MGSIVGFTIFLDLPPATTAKTVEAEERALKRFKHLEKRSLPIGNATLRIWGHASLSDCIHTMPDGSILVLIGSPQSEVPWRQVQEELLKLDLPENFILPWEGRVILLRISADGKRWMLWNDWLGSITTYYAEIPTGRILSTLEPVSVTAACVTSSDIFLPGLVSLLLNGYFMTDWTLYKNVKTIPPDSLTKWDEKGIRSTKLWTVQPSQSRWEASWDDLVDEMHEILHHSIAETIKTKPAWVLPLSSGLDSRLIAGVMASLGVNAYAYTWGPKENTDAIYSRQIAKTLEFPWKHITLPADFLVRYTPQWAVWMGRAMHFHGMYLMSFLDEIMGEPAAPTINGFIGDVISGDGLKEAMTIHSSPKYQIGTEWYIHWSAEQLRSVAKFPVEEALEANAANIKEQIESFPGARFQKLLYLPLRNRQRLFISFLPTLMDYWRGTATPYLNRSYARFCFSLPRAVLDDRRLLGDVFKRYYGKLSTIPGSYAHDPYILTGRYLIKRRAAHALPPALRHYLAKGFEHQHIDVNFQSLQTHGKAALWPLFDVWNQVSEWLDMREVEKDFQTATHTANVKSLRRLQAVQTFAYHFYAAANAV
jgi:hypothetical protein